MELRQLRYLNAVIGRGSFSGAARQLHLTQSALSRQIKALEEELGFIILSRKGKTVTLTESGRVFYDEAIVILDRLDKAVEQFQARPAESPLRIGFLFAFVTKFLSKVLAEFQRQDGGHAELFDLTEEEVIARARSGDIDVAFLPKGSEHHIREFEWTQVAHQSVVLVMPKKHRLSKLAHINPKLIQHEILHGLGPPNFPGYIHRVEGLFRPFGVKPRFHKQTADGHFTLFAAVQATQGLAVQSEGVEEMLPRDLVVRPFHPPLPVVPVLVGVSIVHPSVTAAKFLKTLYQIVPGQYPLPTPAKKKGSKPTD